MPSSPGSTRLSVCMASYNGAAYIREQIDSILPQLGPDDELIVVDDASSDATVAVVKSIADERIALVRSEVNRGYVRTFEDAVARAHGDVIFLSDQDDVWNPSRVKTMLTALRGAPLVVSNFSAFGGDLSRIQSRRLRAADSGRRFRNIFWVWVGVRPYYGCTMAFPAELRGALLPFPRYLTETHDQWIGFVANACGRVVHLETETLKRRLHESNSTPRSMRSVRMIARARWMTARAIVDAFRRRRGAATPPSA